MRRYLFAASLVPVCVPVFGWVTAQNTEMTMTMATVLACVSLDLDWFYALGSNNEQAQWRGSSPTWPCTSTIITTTTRPGTKIRCRSSDACNSSCWKRLATTTDMGQEGLSTMMLFRPVEGAFGPLGGTTARTRNQNYRGRFVRGRCQSLEEDREVKA